MQYNQQSVDADRMNDIKVKKRVALNHDVIMKFVSLQSLSEIVSLQSLRRFKRRYNFKNLLELLAVFLY